jgi:hypothetical protein
VRRRIAAVLLGLALASCKTPDPLQELEIGNVEAYWTVDHKVAQTNYIAPAVRFTLRNKTSHPVRAVQVQAVFRRKGEENQQWGSDWRQVTTPSKPLPPGQGQVQVLKSDARYFSGGAPESFFQHQLFRDAKVEVFARVGASNWVRFASADVERRIGTRELQEGAPPVASPSPGPSPAGR